MSLNLSMIHSRTVIITYLPRSLVVGGLALFSWLLFLTYRYIPNIPNGDDFDMFLRTGIELRNADTSRELVRVLLAPHGEHIIATTRLVTALSLFFFDSLDLRWFVALGLFGCLCSAILLYVKSSCTHTLLFSSISALIILIPAYPQALTWASASIEHLWIMPILLGSLFLSEGEAILPTLGAVLLSLTACFTQGNGVLLLCAISFSKCLDRRILSSVLWGALAGAVLIFFFLPSIEGHLSSQHEGARISFSMVLYFLTFLGCWISSIPWIAMLSGIVIIGIWLCSLSRAEPRSPYWCRTLLTFILLTAVANTIGRSSLGALYPLTQSRYAYPSAFGVIAALGILYKSPLVHFKRVLDIVNVCFIIVGATVLFFSLSTIEDEYRERQELLFDGISMWNDHASGGLQYPDPASAAQLLRGSTSKGFYALPTVPEIEPAVLTQIASPIEQLSKDGRGVIEELATGSTKIFVRGHVAYSRRDLVNPKVLVLFKDGQTIFQAESQHRVRPELFRKKRRALTCMTSFFLAFNRNDLPAGTYTIEIELRPPQSTGISPLRLSTGRHLQVKGEPITRR